MINKKIGIIFSLMILMSFLSAGLVMADTLFEDDFEGDLSKWDVSSSHDVGTSDTVTPGDYYVWIEDDAWIIASIDTTGYENIELSYWRRTAFVASHEDLKIYWRVGDSGSWTLLEEYNGDSWGFKTWNLSPDANDKSKIQIKFKLDDDESNYGLVDEVLVTGDEISKDCRLIIDEPLECHWYDPVDVKWHYTGECDIIDQELYYFNEACGQNSNFIEQLGNNWEREYDWDISSLDDGDYCVCIYAEQRQSQVEIEGCSGTFHLDTTPPVVTKTVGEPSVLVNPQCNPQVEECDYYVNQNTLITLGCDDGQGSGVDTISYRINSGTWKEYDKPFSFQEDSEHLLEIKCVDLVGKESKIHTETFYVDTVAPTIEKTVGEPKILCEEEIENILFIDDFESYTNTGGLPLYTEMNANGWYIYDYTHPYNDDDIILEDTDTPGDLYVSIRDDSYIRLSVDTTGHTNIKLSYDRKTSSLPTKDELEIHWRVGNSGSWTQLEIVQGTDDTWDIKNWDLTGAENQAEIQIRFFLDNDNDDYGFIDDVKITGIQKDCDYYVTQDTDFTFTCTDPDPHPVDDSKVNVIAYWSNDGVGWQEIHSFLDKDNGFTFTNHEDSWHKIEYWCVDALGNEGEHQFEIDIVDTVAPNTIKKYLGPYYQIGSEHIIKWINGITQILLQAIDPEPHPVEVDKIEYRISGPLANKFCENCDDWMTSLRPDMGEWNTYLEPFGGIEESCHVIEYRSTDLLGNQEEIQWQCFFVDKTAPTTIWELVVGECEDHWDWIITMDTEITLSCSEDQEPHPSGTKEICWRMELDGDDSTEAYCQYELTEGYCCEPTDNDVVLNFNEESEHLLEFYCVDNVDKKSTIDSELFKVEGKAFDIPLHKKWNLISVPFVLISENIDEVFDSVNCENEGEIESVWMYDGTDWHVYTPNAPSDLTEMQPGWGYWVKATEDCNLTVGGSLLNHAPEVPPSRPLQPGWNLIGHYGTHQKPVYCSLFSLIDTSIGYPRWSALYGYNPIADRFVPLNAMNPSDKTHPGRGYWIEMDVEDIYGPATTCWGFPTA